MAEPVSGIQIAVLQWARESQGFSIDEVAERMKREPAQIAAWESGESAPTYAQLETLAYKIYKRPLAVFFLPQPPTEPDPETEFRTLPDFDLQDLSAHTRYQIRFAHSLQLSLRELNNDRNPAARQIFRDMALVMNKDIREQCDEIRQYLGVTLDAQKTWRSSEIALKVWRNAINEVGVFVFKHSFKEKQISGFCLLDEQFPVIYLNNSPSKTRQIFSLFHELAHILFHINGISKFDTSYIAQLPAYERRIEQFSNSFAAELLMPSADFDVELRKYERIEDRMIERLATLYSVSREVVFRRLRDKGIVSQELYEQKAAEWTAQAEERADSGGNYYATQSSYLGEHYLKLVLGKYYRGGLTLEQTAEYLGVKPKSVAGLEEFALREAVPE